MPDPPSLAPQRPAMTSASAVLPGGAAALLRRGALEGRITHVERLAAVAGVHAPWPTWVPDQVTGAFARVGIEQPWTHQAAAADLAWPART